MHSDVFDQDREKKKEWAIFCESEETFPPLVENETSLVLISKRSNDK